MGNEVTREGTSTISGCCDLLAGSGGFPLWGRPAREAAGLGLSCGCQQELLGLVGVRFGSSGDEFSWQRGCL